MHLLFTFLSLAANALAMQFSFKQDLVIGLESSSHLECIQFEFHLKNGLGSIVECVADAAAADDKNVKMRCMKTASSTPTRFVSGHFSCFCLQTQVGFHLQSRQFKYRISSYSFRGNYSFLNLTLCTVTFGNSTYRCGNYSRAETIPGNTVCEKSQSTHR